MGGGREGEENAGGKEEELRKGRKEGRMEGREREISLVPN